jgi:hypothetical protein
MADSKYRMFRPGDPGYDPNKRYPWSGVYESLGMQTPKTGLTIDGFYLLDRRFDIPMAIFKNCIISTKPGYKPPLSDLPKPFNSPREAFLVRKGMHLSADHEQLVEIHALVQDPGIGMPKPDCIFYDKPDFHKS